MTELNPNYAHLIELRVVPRTRRCLKYHREIAMSQVAFQVSQLSCGIALHLVKVIER